MDFPSGFFKDPVASEYSDLFSSMTPAIHFTSPPCKHNGICDSSDCGFKRCTFAALDNGQLFFNCGYIMCLNEF